MRVYNRLGDMKHAMILEISLTSRADTNCRGLSAVFMSGMFDSRSKRALAILVSSSEGRCLEGLVGAILLRADMIAVVVGGLHNQDRASRVFCVSRFPQNKFLLVPAKITFPVNLKVIYLHQRATDLETFAYESTHYAQHYR